MLSLLVSRFLFYPDAPLIENAQFQGFAAFHGVTESSCVPRPAGEFSAHGVTAAHNCSRHLATSLEGFPHLRRLLCRSRRGE